MSSCRLVTNFMPNLITFVMDGGCTYSATAESLGNVRLVSSTVLLRLPQEPLVGAAEPDLHNDSAGAGGQTESHHADEGTDVARLLLCDEHERSSEVS